MEYTRPPADGSSYSPGQREQSNNGRRARGGQPGVGRTEPGGMVGPIGLSLYVSHHLIPGEIWELVLPCIIQYIISTIELASN